MHHINVVCRNVWAADIFDSIAHHSNRHGHESILLEEEGRHECFVSFRKKADAEEFVKIFRERAKRYRFTLTMKDKH